MAKSKETINWREIDLQHIDEEEYIEELEGEESLGVVKMNRKKRFDDEIREGAKKSLKRKLY